MSYFYLLKGFKKTPWRFVSPDSKSKTTPTFARHTDRILSRNMPTVRNTGLLFTFPGACVRFTVRRHDSCFIMQLAC